MKAFDQKEEPIIGMISKIPNFAYPKTRNLSDAPAGSMNLTNILTCVE